MKKFILLSIAFFSGILANAQPKAILLEEFTGAHCGNCPMGSYMVDSMLDKYPSLIAVSLHSYTSPDAMFFPQVDTIGTAYAAGAPLGGIDRIYNTTFGYVAIYHNAWDAAIQARLALQPQLNVSLASSWNAVTRNISATITTDILTNLANGDYRFNLYIVEDSVTGTGFGYDQINFYDAQVGNPFFGMGNPIVGFVHRHVVRAILPATWGMPGVIPAAPLSGQSFSFPLNYTLPAGINEDHVSLVAFVSKYSANHQADEALNTIQQKLTVGTTSIAENSFIQPVSINPAMVNDKLNIYFKYPVFGYSVEIQNSTGQCVYSSKDKSEIDVSAFSNGIYFVKVRTAENLFIKKFIKLQ